MALAIKKILYAADEKESALVEAQEIAVQTGITDEVALDDEREIENWQKGICVCLVAISNGEKPVNILIGNFFFFFWAFHRVVLVTGSSFHHLQNLEW